MDKNFQQEKLCADSEIKKVDEEFLSDEMIMKISREIIERNKKIYAKLAK